MALALFLGGLGCQPEPSLRLSPAEVPAGVIDRIFVVEGLPSSRYLRVNGGMLEAVEDLRVEIGGVAASVVAIFGDRIEVRLTATFAPGAYDLAVVSRGGTLRAAGALQVLSSVDGGTQDGGIDGAPLDGGDANGDALPTEGGDATIDINPDIEPGTVLYESLENHDAAGIRLTDSWTFDSDVIRVAPGCGLVRRRVGIVRAGFDWTDYDANLRFRIEERCSDGTPAGPVVLVRAQDSFAACVSVRAYFCALENNELIIGRATFTCASGNSTRVPTPPINEDVWYDLEVSVAAGTIGCTVRGGDLPGPVRHEWTDPEMPRPTGSFGLATDGTTVAFDDIQVVER
ncbi:MAG: hypothetical protein AAGF12_23685 [Myxococcota bacterium]